MPPMSELQNCTIDQLKKSKWKNEFTRLYLRLEYEEKSTRMYKVDAQIQEIPGTEVWKDPLEKFQPNLDDEKSKKFILTADHNWIRGFLHGVPPIRGVQ